MFSKQLVEYVYHILNADNSLYGASLPKELRMKIAAECLADQTLLGIAAGQLDSTDDEYYVTTALVMLMTGEKVFLDEKLANHFLTYINK